MILFSCTHRHEEIITFEAIEIPDTMQDLGNKFILSTKARKSCIVSINSNQGKFWIITECESGKIIYDLHCNDIIECKTVRNLESGKASPFPQCPNDDYDEGIIEDKEQGVPSKVVITISIKIRSNNGLQKEFLDLDLQTLEKDKESSLSICQKWTENILYSILTESINSATDINEKNKRILVLSNPKSGKGNANQLTEEIVLPLIKDRVINYDLLVTQRANQACNFVANLPSLLHRYSSIAIISGDGLVYEIYQGLMSRSDWELACKMPIAIIPGGSGNGLAKTVTYFQDKKITTDTDYAKHCATNLVDGVPRPMDMSCIQTSTGKTYLSFLSFSWGFGAEVDIESEKIRFLGGFRFTVWSLYKLLAMGGARAKISYKPIRDWNAAGGEETQNKLRRKRLKESETSEGSNASDDTGIEAGSTTSLRFPLSNEVAKGLPCNTKLPDILQESSISSNESLSEEWSTIEDKFVMIMVLSKPWLAKDICMAPQFDGLDDGVMWLFMIRKGISRKRMLQIMIAFWDGGHTKFPEAEMIPVTAVRLEPLAEKGIMMVDGEQIDSGPVQAEILPSFANIVY